jgi:hypothetical protein
VEFIRDMTVDAVFADKNEKLDSKETIHPSNTSTIATGIKRQCCARHSSSTYESQRSLNTDHTDLVEANLITDFVNLRKVYAPPLGATYMVFTLINTNPKQRP